MLGPGCLEEAALALCRRAVRLEYRAQDIIRRMRIIGSS